ALGNAVRYLAVARRRGHCDRLAELVPANVRQLSSEQRSSVDHHMRRCPTCQRTADALTTPAALFAAVPFAVVPAVLSRLVPHAFGLVGGAIAPPPPVTGAAHGPVLHSGIAARKAAATVVAIAVVGTAVAILIGHGGSSSGHANSGIVLAACVRDSQTGHGLGEIETVDPATGRVISRQTYPTQYSAPKLGTITTLDVCDSTGELPAGASADRWSVD